MAAPLSRTTSITKAARAWWDDVPEPDKGIVTSAAGFAMVIFVVLTYLVLHGG